MYPIPVVTFRAMTMPSGAFPLRAPVILPPIGRVSETVAAAMIVACWRTGTYPLAEPLNA